MPQIPQANPGLKCPFWKKDMSEVCHVCPMWQLVRGKHPQTGADVDEWNCSLAWLPTLLIDASRQTYRSGSAIESFRNEMVKGNKETQNLLGAKQQLLRGNGEDNDHPE